MAFLHTASFFNIYFGDAQDAIYPRMYLGNTRVVTNIDTNVDDASILDSKPFARVKQILQAEKLYFLHQIHSAQGYCVTPELSDATPPFKLQGDFLITNNRALAIGIMTADCLPVIVYDAVHNAIGIAHAGWRGSVQNIVPTMIRHMQREYGTSIDQLHIFFGPSAGVCCYEVTQEFVENINRHPFFERTLYRAEDKLFFDLSLFNCLQLQEIGVGQTQIDTQFNVCTMCDSRYFSHRRDGAQAGRNMTLVSLK